MRNEAIEAILAAWWAFDHAIPADKAKARDHLHKLVDGAAAGAGASRDEVLDALFGHYKNYRRTQARKARLTVAQLVLKPKSRN